MTLGLFAQEGAKQVTVQGAKLACQVCGCDRFFLTKGQLNTAMASFFGVDWTNPTAACYVCDQCGFVHWFLGPKGSSRVEP